MYIVHMTSNYQIFTCQTFYRTFKIYHIIACSRFISPFVREIAGTERHMLQIQGILLQYLKFK